MIRVTRDGVSFLISERRLLEYKAMGFIPEPLPQKGKKGTPKKKE